MVTWNGDCSVGGCRREARDSSGLCRKHAKTATKAGGGLAGFLRVRVAKDEADEMAAAAVACGFDGPPLADMEWIVERTIRGRQIRARAASRTLAIEFWSAFPWRWMGDAWLQKMALPYADHPGYRDEWRH